MIYQRHIIRTLLYPLAITLTSTVLLVWLSQIMKLAFVIELGIGAFHFFGLTFSAIPTILIAILPIGITVINLLVINYLPISTYRYNINKPSYYYL